MKDCCRWCTLIVRAVEACLPALPRREVNSLSNSVRWPSLNLGNTSLQEEIDEAALPCLTVQDLQSLGVSNPAHQRLILSADLQPATHLAATAATQLRQPSATSTHAVSNPPASRQYSTSTMLPNKALPVASLHSLAAAVASRQDKAAAADVGGVPKGAIFAAHRQAPCGPCHPRPVYRTSAFTVAEAPCRPTVKASDANTHVSAKSATSAIAAASAAAVAKQTTAPSAKRLAAKASAARSATVTTLAPPPAAANSDLEKGVVQGGKRASNAEQGTGRLAHAAVTNQAVALAPKSKADEARQLELALSASLGRLVGESP